MMRWGILKENFIKISDKDIVRKVKSDNPTDSCYNSSMEEEEEEKNEDKEEERHPSATSKI